MEQLYWRLRYQAAFEKYKMARDYYIRKNMEEQVRCERSIKSKEHPILFHRFIRDKVTKKKILIIRLKTSEEKVIDTEKDICENKNKKLESVCNP